MGDGDRRRSGSVDGHVAVAGIGHRHDAGGVAVDGHDAVAGVGRGQDAAVVGDVDGAGSDFGNRHESAIIVDDDETVSGDGDHAGSSCCR